jgi:hypothetical protein
MVRGGRLCLGHVDGFDRRGASLQLGPAEVGPACQRYLRAAIIGQKLRVFCLKQAVEYKRFEQLIKII